MQKVVRREKKRLVAEINITPFTDVILVLLVIFMITTPLISQTAIQVKLPEVSRARPAMKAASRADITVTDSGAIYLDKELMSEKKLRDKIALLHKENPDISVVLRADKAVKFKYIVKVLDLLTELEVKNLNIAAIAGEAEK